VARATGTVAWAGAIGAVLVGLALSTRVGGRTVPPSWLLALHRHLGALTLAFVAGHVGALIADSYVQFSVADALVPFHSGWRAGAVTWGVVGMWLLALVEVTSLLRRRIPRRLWRSIHLTSYGAAVAATTHLLTAGTDVTNRALRWAIVLAVASATGFLTFRMVLENRRPAPRTA
jgi:DMSO/TMAO reductase YedYZ heme-binding membrane subunit